MPGGVCHVLEGTPFYQACGRSYVPVVWGVRHKLTGGGKPSERGEHDGCGWVSGCREANPPGGETARRTPGEAKPPGDPGQTNLDVDHHRVDHVDHYHEP